MAITIQATPAAYSSLQGDLIYTVAEVAHTADPVTFPNYKFVGDVYIAGILVARVKKVPDPVTRIGIFNIGQIVRNYIAVTFSPAVGYLICQRLGAGEFNLSVQMKFGEEYAYTTYTNLTTDSARVFYNNYNGRIINTSSITSLVDKPLSSRPYATPLRDDSSFNFVSFLPSNTTGITVTIKTYNFSNTLVQQLNNACTITAANQLQIMNLSKTLINSIQPGMINDTIKYFTVLFDTPNITDDVTYRFDLICEPIFGIYTVHFLNKFGGFESKDFTKVSRKTISIDKKDFGRLPYTVDISGVVSYKNANNVYNESRSVYSSQYKEKLVLNSDNLTDAEYVWLQELVLSPMVYIEESGSFFPCVIMATDYEPKKYINDDLTNLTINVEYGNQLNTQYR